MSKPSPFIARQNRRRQLERLLRARREREQNRAAHLSVEWSHEAYERLMRDIMALDPACRMLPSGVH